MVPGKGTFYDAIEQLRDVALDRSVEGWIKPQTLTLTVPSAPITDRYHWFREI